MSSDEIESIVQNNIYLIQEYLYEAASRQFRATVTNLEFKATQTVQKIGASGHVLISTIFYETEYGNNQTQVAFKFFNNEQNAMAELKHSLELDVRFKSHPHFATPKVLYASTKDPLLIIYEGVSAVNYDECEILDKAIHAGQLLAAIHTGKVKPVDTETYKGLARIIGTYIAPTGMEREISQGLGRAFDRLSNAMSGCNPYSDFHQSNVMLSSTGEIIDKVYVIDPEFMQKGRFDRLEDVGTFFAKYLMLEYQATGAIHNGLRELDQFLKAYEEYNMNNQGVSWQQMYPNGSPLSFFIAQWAIMDAIDQSMRLGVQITEPNLVNQIKFAKFILSNDLFKFPNSF
ncbi:MAG: hypothetical protein INQ03_20790 [Candidatus Heimdallarchaeota archaeon]|nr:hypothetical protein [Candidatus Heimdallarchaeota archaeon]